MTPVKAFLIVDMDNFSAFERRVDVVRRLALAIKSIESQRQWKVESGRLSMNQATTEALEAADVLPQLQSLCDSYQITINAFAHNRKEVTDHDLLLEIGDKINKASFRHIAVITTDAAAFTLPIERYPDVRFFIVVTDSEVGDNARRQFARYPNVEVSSFGYGGPDNQQRQEYQNNKVNDLVADEQQPLISHTTATWQGELPAAVRAFLEQLIRICQLCGYRTLWSPDKAFCAQCGGGLGLAHSHCRPAGPNPFHPHRFFAIYRRKSHNQVAGLVILPSHLQWQLGDRRAIGRYDRSQPSMIPIDDWLYWLSDSDRKLLSREQIIIAPYPDAVKPDRPSVAEEHVCWTPKENVTLERDGRSVQLAPNQSVRLEIGDLLHIGTTPQPLCVLHYLGRRRVPYGSADPPERSAQ